MTSKNGKWKGMSGEERKKIVPIKDQIRTVSLPAEEFPEWTLMSARIQN